MKNKLISLFPPSSLPKISYMKALDIYLAFCFFMVFGALLEYATVSYSGKRIRLNATRLEKFNAAVTALRAELASRGGKEAQLLLEEEGQSQGWHQASCPARAARTTDPLATLSLPQPPFQCPFRASDIERYSRIAFPLLFLTFHLVYWTLLGSLAERDVEDLIPLITSSTNS